LRLLQLVFLCLPAGTGAQETVLEAQQYLQTANAAYEDNDFDRFVASLEEARQRNPASLATIYSLACGYALSGKPAKALELLHTLVEARVDYGMAEDPDLESLRQSPNFQALVADLEHRVAPVSASRNVLTVDELGLMPEGIAVDSATGRTFFGSMRNGGIYVFGAKRRLSQFAGNGERWVSRFGGIGDGRGFSAIGLAVDGKRNTLWSVGTSTRMAAGFDADAEIKTGLFGFNLETGEATTQYLADSSVEGFNDVTVATNGDLYLSGSVLSVVPNGSDSIRPLETSIRLVGTNGIVVSADGKFLFTSSYPVGIARVDLATGATRFLDKPAGATLYGIDGLYEYEGDLVGVQNGTRPWRLIRLTLNEVRDTVTDLHFIEFANADVTATTGAIVGKEIYYIGQGPAPDPAPSHVPHALVPLFGKTVVMAAPLD
jgi:sugar lactone lactonase YvrE